MLKKILIGGAVALGGTFVTALIAAYQQNVEDYNKLLKEANVMNDFIKNHDFYEKPKESDSPNPKWKHYRPSSSVKSQNSHDFSSLKTVDTFSQTNENGTTSTVTVKEDKESGFKVYSVS